MKKSKLLIVALCISGLFQVHFIKAPGFFEGLFGGARPEPKSGDGGGGSRGRDDGFRTSGSREPFGFRNPSQAPRGGSMPRGGNPGGGRGGVSPTGTRPSGGPFIDPLSGQGDLTPNEISKLLTEMDRPLFSRLTTRSEDITREINKQKEETSRVLLKDFNLRLNMLSVPEGGLGKNFEQGLNALEESSPSAKESIQEVRDIIKDIQSKARRGELKIGDVSNEVQSIAEIILKIKKENAQILRENMRVKYRL